MSERNDLIAMGFAPERVDWAIRDTAPGADLQTRIDHILDHESQPIPLIIIPTSPVPPVAAPKSYPAPSHPPPGFVPPAAVQQHVSPATPVTQALSNSMSQLNLCSPSPAIPSAQPNQGTFEDQAIQRYRDFIEAQGAAIQSAQSDKQVAKSTYFAIMKFFSAEGFKWRAHFQLSPGEVDTPPSTVVASSSNTTQRATLPPSVGQPNPAADLESETQPEVAPVAEASNSTSEEVYDPISIYDPTRTLLPADESMAGLLKDVITGYYEDEPVEAIRKKVGEIRPRITDEISDMRFRTLSNTQGDQGDDGYQQRSTQHYSRLNELYSKNDWATATRLEEEYKQQESRIRQQESSRKHQEYCQTFLDPAKEHILAAFAELHPLYAELERILEDDDNLELDVVRAVRALEEVSDLMEQGMTELENMEDDRRNREFELQRQIITDDTSRSDPWGDATKLENQKKLSDLEIKAERAGQKVDRRNPFLVLAVRKMMEAIVGVDRDKEMLASATQDLLVIIPDAIPLDQEEARAAAGDKAPSKVPLPSKPLYNQISEAHSSLLSINTMCNDMREVLKSLQRKHVYEGRLRDMAQLELSETRQGRGDNWYFGPGSTLRQEGEKEDEAGERAFEQERSERRAAMDSVSAPISSFLTRYKDREMAVLRKLAGGMTANGPMSPSSSGDPTAGGSGDAHTAALTAMQKMLQQQQQTQMISNMMWSQHASRMAVINNIGSSNSQWVVKYS